MDRGPVGVDGGGVSVPPALARTLSDKSADVRKRGATEVDQLVRERCVMKDWRGVHNLISKLHKDFALSIQPSTRKGGLLALSAVAIAVDQNIKDFVPELIAPVLETFKDQDAAVRYQAAEAMYNVAKVSRSHILPCFSDIFEKLCALHADSDRQVQQASHTLDALLKDICTESRDFEVDLFVKCLRGLIRSPNPYVRQFLLSWLSVLETVPDIDLVQHLPLFLGGVISMLSDQNKPIIELSTKVLQRFLDKLRRRVTEEGKLFDWGPIVVIVIENCKVKDERTRGTALVWINTVLNLARGRMLPHCAELLEAVLPCVADREESIRQKAGMANTTLATLVNTAHDSEEERQQALEVLPALFAVLTACLGRLEGGNAMRSQALMWLKMLLQRNQDMIQQTFPTLFPELMKLLCDPSDQVVELDIRVLAMITNTTENFENFLTQMVELLQKENYKLMHRAGMLVKNLASERDANDTFRTLASILCQQEDLSFVSSLVTTLNMILLTAPELLPLRNILKRGLDDPQAADLFSALYRCWCFNAVAVVSLCLLTKAYEHAYALIRAFGEREITVSMMVQIDKLVQLLESPVFTYIRIALLEPAENPYLVKTLFGILMLLPQSSAFEDLHKRLKSVNTLCNLNNKIEALRREGAAPQRDGNYGALLQHYKEVEDRKERYFCSRREDQR